MGRGAMPAPVCAARGSCPALYEGRDELERRKDVVTPTEPHDHGHYRKAVHEPARAPPRSGTWCIKIFIFHAESSRPQFSQGPRGSTTKRVRSTHGFMALSRVHVPAAPATRAKPEPSRSRRAAGGGAARPRYRPSRRVAGWPCDNATEAGNACLWPKPAALGGQLCTWSGSRHCQWPLRRRTTKYGS